MPYTKPDQLNIRIPRHIKEHYERSPAFNERLRESMLQTAEYLFTLEVHQGDERSEEVMRCLESAKARKEHHERGLTAAKIEVQTYEAELAKLENDREDRESIKAKIELLKGNSAFCEYVRKVHSSRLHVTQAGNVRTAIKTNYRVELTDEQLREVVEEIGGQRPEES